MYKTNIQRVVSGDPRDPSSTRDLVGISSEEFKHLVLAINAGIREAELLLLMDDQQLISIVDRSEVVNARFGMTPLLDGQVCPDGLREYFRERSGYLHSLVEKFENAPECCCVCGIVPKEFEHLITSIQAGCREAMVFSGFSDAAIGMGIGAVKAVYRQWKLAEWDVYDGEIEKGGQGFFLKRFKMLEGVLTEVNAVYSDTDIVESRKV